MTHKKGQCNIHAFIAAAPNHLDTEEGGKTTPSNNGLQVEVRTRDQPSPLFSFQPAHIPLRWVNLANFRCTRLWLLSPPYFYLLSAGLLLFPDFTLYLMQTTFNAISTLKQRKDIHYRSKVFRTPTHSRGFLHIYYFLHSIIIVKTSKLWNNTYGIMQ